MKKAPVLIVCVFLSLSLLMAPVPAAAVHQHSFGEEVPVIYNGFYYIYQAACVECGYEGYRYYDALVTFLDDDGRADAMEHWEHIIDQTGIKMTSALPTGKITQVTDNKNYYCYTGWDTVDRLKNKGIEFVSHSHSHKNLTAFTTEQLRQDFSASRALLQAHGLRDDLIVYPFNASNETSLSVIKEYFIAGVCCGGLVNTAPADFYQLHRVDIYDTRIREDHDFYGDTVSCYTIKSQEKLRQDVGAALQQHGWLIYMCHAHNSPGGYFWFDEGDEQSIVDFCRYIQGLGNVKIITLGEGVDLFRKSSGKKDEARIGHTAHVWDAGRETEAPTCAKAGERRYTCTVCGATVTELIGMTEHRWDGGAQTVPSTCLRPGVRTFTCTVCGAKRTEATALAEHVWDNGVTVKPATCDGSGSVRYSCKACGVSRTEIIPGSGTHMWDSYEVVQAPACTRTGRIAFTCSVCGATKTGPIPLKNHIWKEGGATAPAASAEEGASAYYCLICGTEKTEPSGPSGDDPAADG